MSTRPPHLDDFSLAQSTAHELNNIAASLFGFVELAAEQIAGDSPLARCLDEIRIGVSRVRNLTSVLEALAESDGVPVSISLRDCLGGDARAPAGGGYRFAWDCDPALRVLADADLVRRAVRTLAHLGRTEWTLDAEVTFTVGRAAADEHCALCAAPLLRDGARITLIAGDAWLFDAGRAARRRAGRTFRELIFSGVAHATHLAGGHVALDAARSSVSLLLAGA